MILISENYLYWLGTGSGLNPALGNTSFLITGNNRSLLVECGSTVPNELVKTGKIRDVKDIIITHTHADHIGGLESMGFMNYYALRRRGTDKPNLYLASDDLAHNLWEYSLKGGLEHIMDDEGNAISATLSTYFNIHVGKKVSIDGLPVATLFETPHVKNLENYGLLFENGIYYSGDSLCLPPSEPKLIFQDCQFFEGKADWHISYKKLKRELFSGVKSKTCLVHLGNGWEKKDARADGFAGFVKPGDRFNL